MTIEATYVISLRSSEERWRSIQKVLEDGRLPAPIRWDAVDGSALHDAAILELQSAGKLATDLSRFGVRVLRGELGCALSHVAVLEDIVQRQLPAALILEDDVILAGDVKTWSSRYAAAWRGLPADWDLWYLYRCFDIRHRSRRAGRRNLRPFSPLGAAAYAVTLQGARRLLEIARPVWNASDRMYLEGAVRPGLVKAYAASPMLIDPGSHPSIINRDYLENPFIVDGINRPPEYWPKEYYQYLGEPKWRTWPLRRIALTGSLALIISALAWGALSS